ncbi:nucleobase:cation symporter-2 family protein [Variovorax arabinosiphilus]|uniref:nucleobase:cation symporter-2 family protein n=1 Tax=Variovorax arabinosiphilus TaxID=3053498 RepID=UPI0025776E8F|nr:MULTISPECIES: nucleobase:cation symporter-2 family protein [unclassified Variovorax]MDM0120364.1 nucleobase:cation symporter-2 family protein [Variovorax sp. J2L1-78]MDM0127724.1 nucleobase:cation symporter-2 family protein [Variovorax sp. J2L1-63]MDM0231423.1 nucleobase:cation symporter-2 family protein [Variovorax sp. J2R1-6]
MRSPGSSNVHPVDQKLPLGKLTALGLQHVLVMYAGAVAVPLIVGRALKLSPSEVALLISADLFCCGIATLIQSLGATQWFGIKLPVMMGVTFASVAPMVAIANANPGLAGAQLLFGSIIGAGVISVLIAPMVSRLLRFFPPVVTGTIIAVIGISLMRVGINWIFGNPFGPTAPAIVDPAYAKWLADVTSPGSAIPPVPKGFAILPTVPNPKYADLTGFGVAALVLVSILLIVKYAKGFIANISVLLGIAIGGVVATAMGIMTYEKVGKAPWFDVVLPFHFGMPQFDPILILTMTLIMIVVMIESTGMFLALGEMTDRKIDQKALAKGLRTDGLGTLIGGLFNTFPYTSFSQNVGLVAVTGIKSRYVCVAGGVILVVLGLLPKMAALIESLPTVVLGGAGLVMFGMVAATGIRILSGVDFKTNRHNPMIVAVSIGVGMIPLIAPNFKQWMPHGLHSLIESGILLASITAVLLNLFLNGTKHDEAAIIAAAKQAEAH